MDPLDDFEFRPLTEGLGFHKKSVKLQDQVQKSGMVESKLATSMPLPPPPAGAAKINSRQSLEDLLKALDKPMPSTANTSAQSNVQLTEPLARPDFKAMDLEIPIPGPTPRPTFEIPVPGSDVTVRPVQRPVHKPMNLGTGPKRGAANSPISKLVPATMSFQAAFLDAMVVTAVTLLFLVSLILVTKIDITSVVASAKTDGTTQISLGLLFLAVMQMYIVVARSFYGRTLGEWTFEFQLGRDEDQKKAIYPLKVALRSLLIVITGMILLPLLSVIMDKDLAGRLTGVSLYQQRMEPLG